MPEMIEFPCPYSDCGKLIKTDAAFAGRSGSCPHCSRSVTVPGRRREVHPVSTALTDFADAITAHLRFLRGRTDGFWFYQRVLSLVGSYSIIIAGVLFAMQLGMLSVRAKNVPLFLGAIGCLFAAFLLHYVAAKFAMSGGALLRHNALTTAQTHILDCVGFLTFVLAVLLFFSGIGALFFPGGALLTPIFLAAAAVFGHCSIFSLNPVECLNIHKDSTQTGEGEGALAVVTFLARCMLVLVPVRFAVLAVLGTVAGLVATITAVSPSPVSFFDTTEMHPLFLLDLIAAGLVVLAGLLPAFCYVCYLFVMLAVNFCQSVVSAGRKTPNLDE